MGEPKTDRRVQRTRLLLRSAMVALIRERGFEAITVQDILDRADVGRSTFYAHYRSKEDLLAGGVALVRASLRQLQRRASTTSGNREERLFAFSGALFAHAEEHRDVFAAMVGKRSGTVFQQHMLRMITELVRDDVTDFDTARRRDPAQLTVLVEFIAGGLMGLLATWLERLPEVPAAEMDRRFRRIAIPCVEAGLAPESSGRTGARTGP